MAGTVRAYLDRPRKHVNARREAATYGPGIVEIPEAMAVGLRAAGVNIDLPEDNPGSAAVPEKSGEPRRPADTAADPVVNPPAALPDDFPGLEHLQAAGLTDPAAILAHEDLTEIDGIGKVTAGKILAALED